MDKWIERQTDRQSRTLDEFVWDIKAKKKLKFQPLAKDYLSKSNGFVYLLNLYFFVRDKNKQWKLTTWFMILQKMPVR